MSAPTPTLEYYHPADHKDYLFMKLPNFLFDDPSCQKLSSKAKLLYGKLLDTMRQEKAPKTDRENRVYILFSVKMTCDFLNCSESTAKRIRKELKDCFGKDTGLVKFDSHGQGNPDYVYIMHYNTSDADVQNGLYQDSTCEDQNEPSGSVKNEPSRSVKNELSREIIHELPKELKSDPYIIKNNKESFKKDNIYLLSFTNPTTKETDEDQLFFSSPPVSTAKGSYPDRYTIALEDFKTQISYEQLLCYAPGKTALVDDMTQVMAQEYVACSEDTIINGRHYSRSTIKDCLKSIDLETAKYVLDCLCRNNTKIVNIQRYILATLLNAPASFKAQKAYEDQVKQNRFLSRDTGPVYVKPTVKRPYEPYQGRSYTDEEIHAFELKKLGITG